MNSSKLWRKKQKYAAPGRYYGGMGTVHETEQLDVEVLNGQVVATPRLTGVEVIDPIE